MKLRQMDSFPIKNYDRVVESQSVSDDNISKNGPFLPNNVRAIVCGPSGKGKSNFTLNMILDEKSLKFCRLIMCSKSLNQDKYSFLDQVLAGVPEIEYLKCANREEFPQINEESENHTLVIFDDVDGTFNDLIQTFFTRGRHYKTDSFYLIQSYASCMKHFVRDNANLIVVFPQDGRNLNLIWRDHAHNDMTYPTFLGMCRKAFSKPFNFLLIDKSVDIQSGRYRSGMDSFFEFPTIMDNYGDEQV